MAARRKPRPRLLKYSKNRGVFCHVTHDEMAFSEVVSSVWQPCLFSCNLKALFKRNEDISSCLTWQNPHEFLEPFSSLGQRFLRPAILNEEKALGTRLLSNVWQSYFQKHIKTDSAQLSSNKCKKYLPKNYS